jgi:membrane protease YdiL (CAAX protease family)
MTIDRGMNGAGFALRRTALFFAYLFGALSIAAVLSYPLVQTGWLDYEPQRIMGRLAQLIILLGLWPFLRWLSLADRHSLGFAPPRTEILRTVRIGWLLGVLTLLALVVVELVLEIRVPEDDWARELPSLLSKALGALIGGLLIGLGEEMFFRGALYTSIRRGAGVAAAAAFSALLYALVHFMKPHALPDGMVFDGFGVWTMFAGVFVGLFQWQHLDSLGALFAAGVLLALVRERSGHIGWCIGLHAGWVFVIQLTRRVTDGNEASELAFLVGGYDGVIGWLGAAWIALLAAVYWRMTKPPHGSPSQ